MGSEIGSENNPDPKPRRLQRIRILSLLRLIEALRKEPLTAQQMADLLGVTIKRIFYLMNEIRLSTGLTIDVSGSADLGNRTLVYQIVDYGAFDRKRALLQKEWVHKDVDGKLYVDRRYVNKKGDGPQHYDPEIFAWRYLKLVQLLLKRPMTRDALLNKLSLTRSKFQELIDLIKKTCGVYVVPVKGTESRAANPTLELEGGKTGIFDHAWFDKGGRIISALASEARTLPVTKPKATKKKASKKKRSNKAESNKRSARLRNR